MMCHLKPFTCYEKMHLKMSSAEVICCMSGTNLGIQTNSVDADETAPVGAVLSGSTLFATEDF